MADYWFRKKKYGYGWYPNNKKGWLVILFYVLAVIVTAFATEANTSNKQDFAAVFTLLVILETTLLILVTISKGERLNK